MMKASVYDYLNEMDSRPEEYPAEQVSGKELRRWKKEFDKRRAPSHRKRAGYVAAAAVLAAVVAAGQAGIVRQTVYAGIKAVTYDLSELLGIEKNLESYKTVVGGTVTKDGYTVTLNEVIIDEESLYVSDTLTLPEKMESEFIGTEADCMVFLNGKQVSMAGSGFSEKADDYNIVSSMKVEMPGVDTTERLDMEFVYYVEGKKIGSFEFAATGEELALDTLTVPLDEAFILPDGEEIVLERYTSNAMGQKIYYTAPDKTLDYNFILKGEDDMGNPVEFFVRYSEKGRGRLEVETLDNGYISDKAKFLTLTPYAAEKAKTNGRENSDYEQTGAAFTIQINGKERAE